VANETILVGLIGLFSTILTFIFTRPKQHAEITGVISEASSVAIDSLLKVTEELRIGMDEIRHANDLLKLEISKLVDENVKLQAEIEALKVQNDKLLSENVKLRKEIHKINTNFSK
jgi:cell division protein FtsB